MARYVDELHSIVETMSYSDNVANFLEAPTKELQTINMDDLELIAGDILKKVNSQPNTPLASRDASPIHNSRPESIDSTAMLADDESDEEYIDTIEAPEPKKIMNDVMYFEPTMNGILQKEHSSRTRTRIHNVDISAEISKAVQNIQLDIEHLRHKIQTLERDKAIATKKSTFFDNFSPTFLAFLIVWPFLCNFVMQRYLKNK
ncbi:hypothetical protein WA026_004892 [Henosepilachna vigintioctopunctata]|uniref:Uncharacterized protein n=1 Tax=Henosepilachna vigintioctopunctata TaxID=420089 RepID=A0AAW1ULI7_9CUCU